MIQIIKLRQQIESDRHVDENQILWEGDAPLLFDFYYYHGHIIMLRGWMDDGYVVYDIAVVDIETVMRGL